MGFESFPTNNTEEPISPEEERRGDDFFRSGEKINGNKFGVEDEVSLINFESALSKEDFKKTVDIFLGDSTFSEVLRIQESDLDSCEDDFKLLHNDNFEFNPNESNYLQRSSYFLVRNLGFTKENINNLIKSVGDEDKLSACFQEIIFNEKEKINGFLKKPESLKKIEDSVLEMREFFKELNIPFPREGLAPTYLVGDIEALMLRSFEIGSINVGLAPGGEYSPKFDRIIVTLDDSDTENEVLSDSSTRRYIHENFHSFSFNNYEETSELNSEVNLPRVVGRCGFFTLNNRNKNRQSSLTGLNEGVTEFLSRIVADKLGFEKNKEYHAYDSYVEDAENLMIFLNQGNLKRDNVGSNGLGLEGIKDLAYLYTSKTGIFSLARKMKELIGPHSIALFDLFSEKEDGGGFSKFLEALEKFKKNGELEIVSIERKNFNTYGINEGALRESYPFLDIV